jgi:uncharacterized protein (DUF58 family)
MSTKAVGLTASALTLLVVGLSTGAAIYYLMFGMLAAMLALAVITCVSTLLSVRVRLKSPRFQVVRGGSVTLNISIRRFTLLPVSEIVVFISSAADEGSFFRMPVALGPYEGKDYRFALNCPHRGRYAVGPKRLEVSDAFGIFTFNRRLRIEQSALEVLPKVMQASPMVLEPGDSGPQTRIRMADDAASPSDVRAWREGDVLKKVHWKLTMRRRELMVRTYEESARPDTLILLDVSPINAIRSKALTIEDALCEASLAMVKAQLSADHPVRMPLTSQDPAELAGRGMADFSRFLEAIMHLNFDGQYPFEQLMLVEMRRIQRTGGMILVTARLTASIADAALNMRRSGMQVMFMWITDSPRTEAMELLTGMSLGGIMTRRVNPWRDLSEGSISA